MNEAASAWPTISLLAAPVMALLGVGVGHLLQGRREHSKWLRDERLAAYIKAQHVISRLDDMWSSPASWRAITEEDAGGNLEVYDILNLLTHAKIGLRLEVMTKLTNGTMMQFERLDMDEFARQKRHFAQLRSEVVLYMRRDLGVDKGILRERAPNQDRQSR